MISKELLDILRCPLDPARSARLEEEADGLVCQRCRLKFPIKEGLPCMLVEDAQLPSGVSSLQALPCQQTSVPQGAQG
ncbi:MAG: Trm112 family protein [Gemmataceae bacterium]